jgi:hypothetical protein
MVVLAEILALLGTAQWLLKMARLLPNSLM